MLRERGIAWQNHPQGSMQQNLLTGEAGFYQKGVIYALVNQDNWFHVKFPVYVGQTSGHVVERVQRHMDKANDASTQNLEPKIVEALRNTKRWWQKLVMIPLESVPLPTDCQPGTQQFLKKFRASAIVREQAWIRRLKTGFPKGLNIEVHEANPATQKRWQLRSAQQEKSKAVGKQFP